MQAGDKVRSRDPQTGRESVKTVTATIKRLAPAVVSVSLTDAKTGQSETLTCTPEHPFFVTGQGWVEAGSLGIGTSIVSRAGPALSVTNVTWKRNQGKELAAGSSGSTPGGYVVYNLTVEDDHTFFVGTTGGGTWVHNINCADDLDALSDAGKAADRGGLTKAGRALAKHGGRPGSAFPNPTGSPDAINEAGQNALDDILTDPASSVTNRLHGRFGNITEVTRTGAGGARFGPNGELLGFLEP